MEYQVSARKYRPSTFQDLIGQPHVVQTLKNAIATKRVAHAYLFSGMRGVGKTTAARILAKALNCVQGPTEQPCDECESCVEIARGNSVDVIEIDGASNTGVDDVRELRENVKFAPFRGSYRVYIIDEVHMLSNSAFNALLKTLEEPPAHAIFIFATTEIHKIPATILSRCQHFNFRRIPRLEIVDRLRHVAEQNAVAVEDRGLALIARVSDGSMRDALSLLDQAVAFGGATVQCEDLEKMLGSVPDGLIRDLVTALIGQNAPRGVELVAEIIDRGYDLRSSCSAVVERIRHLLMASVVPSREQVRTLMDLPVEEVEQIIQDAQACSSETLQAIFEIFSRVEDALRGTMHPRFAFEVAVVRASHVTHRHSEPTSPADDKASRKNPAAAPPRAQTPRPSGPPKPILRSTENRPQPQSVESRPDSATRIRKPEASSAKPIKSQGERLSVSKPRSEQPPTMAKDRSHKPETAKKVTAPSNPALSMVQWESVVDRVVKHHPNIGTFLEMGTLVTIDHDQVVIGYPKTASVACSRIQKEENRGVVARLVQETAGRPIPIRVVELKEAEAMNLTIGQARAKLRENEEQTLLEETRAHPLVKQAMEIFGGEVVKARRDPIHNKEAS